MADAVKGPSKLPANSDADRLRAAADRLDDTADKVQRWSNEDMPEQRAFAQLLRAVADESEVCWCGPEYTERGLTRPGCPAHDVMIASRATALVVARTILGDTDD